MIWTTKQGLPPRQAHCHAPRMNTSVLPHHQGHLRTTAKTGICHWKHLGFYPLPGLGNEIWQKNKSTAHIESAGSTREKSRERARGKVRAWAHAWSTPSFLGGPTEGATQRALARLTSTLLCLCSLRTLLSPFITLLPHTQFPSGISPHSIPLNFLA